MRRFAIILTLIILTLAPLNLFAQSFTLPVPSGKYNVGTAKFYLKDVYREEKFTPDPHDYREYMIRAWYPAGNTENLLKLKYLEGYHIDTLKYFWKMFNISEKLFDLVGEVETNSFVNAPVSDDEQKFPVIIFSHGYGLGNPELYSFISENLASHGYIVLSLTHPYETAEITFEDKPPVFLLEERANKMLQENLLVYGVMKNASNHEERVAAVKEILSNSPVAMESLTEWVKDAKYLLNLMENPGSSIPGFLLEKFDLEKIGALGHSFGGAMAGQLAVNDWRIKAVMNLDGFQYGDLTGKELGFDYAMVYSSFNDHMNDAIFTATAKNLHFITIKETMHFAFTDMVTYPDAFDKTLFIGNVDKELFIDILNDLIINFFDGYLKNTGEFPSAAFMNKYDVDIKSLRK